MRVLLTGASMGIGEAAARAFARQGARLALVARKRDRLERVAGEVRALGGEAVVIPADLSLPEDTARVVPEAIAALGAVDVLVNNAGLGMASTFDQMKIDDLRYLMEVNLFSPVALMQAALPHFRAQGSGVIVNVSSVIGKIALPTASGYSATKFALNGISDASRVELEPDGIRIVTLCPGRVETPFHDNVRGGLRRPKAPGGWQPEAVADAIVAAAKDPPRERVLGLVNKVFVGLSRLSPGFTHWALGRAYARYRRENGAAVPSR